MALTVGSAWYDDGNQVKIREIQAISGYSISLYEHAGTLLFSTDTISTGPALTPKIVSDLNDGNSVLVDERQSDTLYVFTVYETSLGESRFIRISKAKSLIYQPITTIRWIIYSGMFISIGLILLVSNLLARYLARPITELKEATQKIAEGKANRVMATDRSDEFGELAQSINSMASQLREDNDRLTTIHSRQSRFFEDITHEIRNPLHTIMVSMELLESGRLSAEKQHRYIQNARGQAQRMSNLFKDLLTLQRYDSDENFIRSQWFDLQRVTAHLEEIYVDAALSKGLSLYVEKTPCRVLADAPKIEQVLDNLISNAIKYTSEGEIRVDYTVMDKKVTIAVTDSGIGIDKEHQDNLFDRFFRTDKARSRDLGGTGLGLSVVKSILDAHGSTIHVESELGKGTRFWFCLTAK
jgi:signal transduction histidine kinase